LNKIRLATKEEIERIRPTADLDYAQQVYALDNRDGTADLAVYRLAPEIDPAYFSPSSDTRRRATFVRDLETVLWAQGVPAYYFSTLQSDVEWNTVVAHWGAEPLWAVPHQRYKKILIEKAHS